MSLSQPLTFCLSPVPLHLLEMFPGMKIQFSCWYKNKVQMENDTLNKG